MILHIVVPLLLAPFLLGIINRVKAIFAGRCGQPLLQCYYDLLKLLRKDFVYSKTTTLLFRLSPLVSMATVLTILFLLPMQGNEALLSFKGDIILLLYLLALMRFMMVLAAMDTGSSFEGMGAAREVYFAAFAEPAMIMVIGTLAFATKDFSLSGILGSITPGLWREFFPQFFLALMALFALLLLETSRIPFDDPNTHLELTMIHEVMVLDHGSFDFGLITYANVIKMWIFSSIISQLVLPFKSPIFWVNLGVNFLGIVMVAITIGIVESVMARLKLSRVPLFIAGTGIIGCLSLLLIKG